MGLFKHKQSEFEVGQEYACDILAQFGSTTEQQMYTAMTTLSQRMEKFGLTEQELEEFRQGIYDVLKPVCKE